MTPSALPYSVTLTVLEPRRLQAQLNEAIDAAIQEALKAGTGGIVLTRHSPTTYTVQLSEAIPFGLTAEADKYVACRADGSEAMSD